MTDDDLSDCVPGECYDAPPVAAHSSNTVKSMMYDASVIHDQKTQWSDVIHDMMKSMTLHIETDIRKLCAQNILSTNSLVQAHIEPMNICYMSWIPEIFLGLAPFSVIDPNSRVMHRIKIVQVHVTPPVTLHPDKPNQMVTTPPYCMSAQDSTYDIEILLTIQHSCWTGDVLPAKLDDLKAADRERIARDVPPNLSSRTVQTGTNIRIPTMLWTVFCSLSRGYTEAIMMEMPNDRGAYFYSNKTKQFLSAIETTCCNMPFLKTSSLPPTKQKQSLGPNPWSVLNPNPAAPSASPAGRKRLNQDSVPSSRKRASRVPRSVPRSPASSSASTASTSSSSKRAPSASSTSKIWYAVVEVRGMNELRPFDTTRNMLLTLSSFDSRDEYGGYRCSANVQYGRSPLPITVLTMAFGWSIAEFADQVCLMSGSAWDEQCSDILFPTLFHHPSDINNPDMAKIAIARVIQKDKFLPTHQLSVAEQAKYIAMVETWMGINHLPMCGVSRDSFPAKNNYMAWLMSMVVLKIRYPKQVADTKRDHYSTRRLQLSSFLVANLARQLVDKNYWHKVEVEFAKYLKQPHDNTSNSIQSIFNGSRLSSQLASAFATGVWTTITNVSKQRKGVAMTINMTNPSSYFACVRRNTTVLQQQNSKQATARQMDPSHRGKNCPSETPEGGQCGLVRFPSISTRMSTGTSSSALIEWLNVHPNEFPYLPINKWNTLRQAYMSSPLAPALAYRAWGTKGEGTEGVGMEAQESTNADNPEPFVIDPTQPCVMIFVNGAPIGWTQRPVSWVTTFRNMRRDCLIDSDDSISWTSQCIRANTNAETSTRHMISIWTDAGRMMRPLVVAERWAKFIIEAQRAWNTRDPDWVQYDRAAKSYKWQRDRFSLARLMQQGIIEYIDAQEEQTLSIRSVMEWRTACERREQITHIEVFDSWMFGTSAGEIPWPNYNQSPRNSYQCAMGKQAFTEHGTPFIYNNGVNYLLHYGQRPIVQTCHSHDLKWEEIPTGINASVMFLAKEQDADDGVEICESALQVGAFEGETTRTLHATTRRTSSANVKESFERPDPSRCLGMKDVDYTNIDDTGMAPLRTKVKGGQPVICKTAMIPKLPHSANIRVTDDVLIEQSYRKYDESVFASGSEGGTVIQRIATMHPQTHKDTRKVTLSTMRTFKHMGDKISSRHGQKGVAGAIVPRVDMPFTTSGHVPMIVMNPMAFPSRMTGAHMAEMHAGYAAAHTGEQVDATAFTIYNPNYWDERLVIRGCQRGAKHTTMDGKTGEMLIAPVEMGYIYIQRLRHLAEDKHHARARGPYHPLTHQPVESRNKEGGLRFGTMEGDCMTSAGASEIQRERMITCSDEYTMWVCARCGLIAIANPHHRYFHCRVCEKSSRIYPVTIGYATKLLIQELYSLGVLIKLQLDETDADRASEAAYDDVWEPEHASDNKTSATTSAPVLTMSSLNNSNDTMMKKSEEQNLQSQMRSWLQQLQSETESLDREWKTIVQDEDDNDEKVIEESPDTKPAETQPVKKRSYRKKSSIESNPVSSTTVSTSSDTSMPPPAPRPVKKRKQSGGDGDQPTTKRQSLIKKVTS